MNRKTQLTPVLPAIVAAVCYLVNAPASTASVPDTSASTQVCIDGVGNGADICISGVGPRSPTNPSGFISGFGPATVNVTGGPSSSSVARSNNDPGFTAVTGTASMLIDRGTFSAFASASGKETAIPLSRAGYTASAFGGRLDTLTIASGSVLDLPLHLTGAVSIEYSVAGGAVVPGTDPSLYGDVRLEILCGAGGRNCSQELAFTSSSNVDTVLHFLIPFTAGTAFDLGTEVRLVAALGIGGITTDDLANGRTAVITGHATGDFSHTGVYEGATVLDANGNVLTNAAIQSASGFDYRAGVSAVPIPGAFWLLASALTGLRFSKQPRATSRVRQLL